MHANRAAICRWLDMRLNLLPNLGPQLNDSLCVGEAENAGGCAICVNVVLKNVVFFAFSNVLLSVL